MTLAIAIVLGLLAVMVMNRRIAGSKVAIPTVEVLVAKENLARGIELTPDMVELKQVAQELVGAGSLKKTEDAIERALLAPIAKGELCLITAWARRGPMGWRFRLRKGCGPSRLRRPNFQRAWAE